MPCVGARARAPGSHLQPVLPATLHDAFVRTMAMVPCHGCHGAVCNNTSTCACTWAFTHTYAHTCTNTHTLMRTCLRAPGPHLQPPPSAVPHDASVRATAMAPPHGP
eukprot:1160453-Pelagomonas_calceolata.AAC.11